MAHDDSGAERPCDSGADRITADARARSTPQELAARAEHAFFALTLAAIGALEAATALLAAAAG